MLHPKRLLLWDIDGTILPPVTTVHGQGFVYACQHVLNVVPNFSAIPLAGQTDRSIVSAGLQAAGVDDATISAHLDEIFSVAAQYVEDHASELIRTALPGVIEVMRHLHSLGYAQGLVTGNLPRIAQAKLAAAGVATYMSHGGTLIGGFGDASLDRADLVAAGIRAAEQAYGTTFLASQVAVIGDTPNDIRAGRACGVRAIGVMTGKFNAEDLAHADLVLPSLRHAMLATSRISRVFRDTVQRVARAIA